jgi:hypothetical protein
MRMIVLVSRVSVRVTLTEAMFNFNQLSVLVALALIGCSNDDNGPASEAQRRGVGAECTKTGDCMSAGTSCLTQFRGGYCGLANCTSDTDCPAGSACVAHDDGTKYCFLVCVDKVDCNLGRSEANAANCVANISFVSGAKDKKACVPPNGG